MRTLGKVLIWLAVIALIITAALFITVWLVDDFNSISDLIQYLLPTKAGLG